MTPIVVPMTIETTQTTIPATVESDAQELAFDIDHVTAPVQIDFTADAETLPAGSAAEVSYSQKHFRFAIPQGVQGEQGETGAEGRPGADGRPGRDGVDGQNGEDGFSPTATVSKEGRVSTLTVTDKTGTTTVEIEDGANGQDGFSPAATVTKEGSVSTLSVTDKTGTTSVNINDGTTPDMSVYRTAAEQDTIDAGKLSTTGTAKRAAAMYYGQVDDTSTSTKFTAQIDGITEYYDGLTILLKNGIVTSASGFTVDINGLGGKQAYNNLAAATAETTLFNINYTLLFVYDSTRVAGGCWVIYKGYDSNTNTIGYQVRTNSYSLPMKSITYRYRILFTSADNKGFVPANNSNSTNATASRTVCQDPINPFGAIVYYGTTASVAAGSRPSAANLWNQYTLTLGYSFNRTGAALVLTTWKPVYVKCAPQSDGSAIMDSDNPYVQDLPTTADGKIYIFLGVAYSETSIEITENHPVYFHDGTNVRLWTFPKIPEKTSDLTNDSGFITGLYIMSYGNSTWQDFITAFSANKVVYCRASSNSNPGTGSQNRLAFMAYTSSDDPATITEVEFQYYRSVSSHSDSQQGDQVFVYKLNKTNGWSVTTREAYTKIVAGTGLTSTYSNGVLTIKLA